MMSHERHGVANHLTPLFVQPFIQAYIIESTKALHYWPFVRVTHYPRWTPSQRDSNAENYCDLRLTVLTVSCLSVILMIKYWIAEVHITSENIHGIISRAGGWCDTVKPVFNDHLYYIFYYLWFIHLMCFNEDWRCQSTLTNNFCLLELI